MTLIDSLNAKPLSFRHSLRISYAVYCTIPHTKETNRWGNKARHRFHVLWDSGCVINRSRLVNRSLFFWKCYCHITYQQYHWSSVSLFYNLIRGSFHTWLDGNAIMRQEEFNFMTTITPPERMKYSAVIMQSIQNIYFQKHILS